ncbi:MAG: ferritin-like domain-containing protein [Bacteroidota bacterium]
MDNEKAIEVLNSLIVINNDRIEGYERAYKETEEADLKALFSKMSSTSQKCKSELVAEVNKLGGEAAEGTTTSGKFFRIWMDVKAALSGKDRKAILSSCEFGEDFAVKTYEEALEHSGEISSELHTMISSQYSEIKADHDAVKRLRDALKVS